MSDSETSENETSHDEAVVVKAAAGARAVKLEELERARHAFVKPLREALERVRLANSKIRGQVTPQQREGLRNQAEAAELEVKLAQLAYDELWERYREEQATLERRVALDLSRGNHELAKHQRWIALAVAFFAFVQATVAILNYGDRNVRRPEPARSSNQTP